MLLTDLVLSKKGPLAKVWISAHHERKLSKAQALQVDVGETVDAILEQNVEPIALRVSGQLMLGVVRIYSRKVQYLFDDCKEARDRITLAFRPGVVDLPEDQLRASKNAITFTENRTDFDIMMGDFDWDFNNQFAPRALHLASASDITLPRALYAQSDRSYSIAPEGPDGVQSGLDSQEFEEEMDLGLDIGDESLSVEFGRNVEVARSARGGSIMSDMRFGGGKGKGREHDEREGSKDPLGFDMDMDLPLDAGDIDDFRIPGMGGDDEDVDMDLGLDLGDDFGNSAPNAAQGMAEPPARAHVPLRSETPQAVEAGDISSLATMTPRTAAQIANAADKERDRAKAANGEPKKKKTKMAAVDEEIELEFERGNRRDVSAILGKENYVPANKAMISLLQVRADPQTYFLPTIKRGGQNFFVGAPPGLAPELAEMFTFPVNFLRRKGGDLEGESPRKRARMAGDDESVEMGRRQSVALSVRSGGGRFGLDDLGMDLGDDTGMGMGDDFQFDLDVEKAPGREGSFGDDDEELDAIHIARRQGSPALSILGNTAFEEALATSDSQCLIGMFDTRPRDGPNGSQAASQSQTATQSIVDEAESAASRRRNGYSQNTTKAVALLQNELKSRDGVLSFEKASEKGSRRAASSFFFELLVLGTRDSLKIKQETPFGDIEVSGKPKLWVDSKRA